MSNIILGGGPSGGGSVTLQAPNTNSNQILSLPDVTSTIVTNATNGLARVASGTLSGAGAITVDGCFTSTYLNYVIYVNATYTGSGDQDAYFNFRAGGVTNSTSNHPYQTNYINAAVNAGTAGAATSSGAWILYDNMDSGSIFNGNIQVFNPQTVTKTTAQWFLYGEDGANFKQMLGFGFQSQATSFDGFVLTMQSGTLTGTYDVYGVVR